MAPGTQIHRLPRYPWVLQKHGRGSVFVIFTENGHSGCAENVVKVVNFRLGRLQNTAPVHKSKFRKRVEFILVLGCFLACFWEPFWEPLGHLGGLWGYFGPPWGHLGPPWPAMGCSGTLLGLYFARLGCLFNIWGSKV